MNKYFHNIEKSKFRKHEYIGYAGGDLFFIRKSVVKGWEVISRENPSVCFKVLTLEEASKKLDEIGKPIRVIEK